MAEPPIDDEPIDRALEHVVKHLFDTELTRLAYARPRSDGDERRAAAARHELARRAAEAPVAVPASTVAARPARVRRGQHRRRGELAPRIPNRPARPRTARPSLDHARAGRRRAGALTAAGALLLSTVAALSATAAPVPDRPPSSLQTLYREATAVERELRDRMLAAGILITVGPRILATDDRTDGRGGESVLAYRYVKAGTAETARNDVCVLLADAETLHPPACVERAGFLADGLRATLVGTSVHLVQWGPSAPAEVTLVGSGDARRSIPSTIEGPAAP